MLIFTLLLLLLLTAMGWYLSRDLFAPFVVMPGIWSIILFFHQINPGNFFPVTHDFPFALTLWVLGFCLCSLLPFLYDKHKEHKIEGLQAAPINMTVIKTYLWISVFVLPIVIVLTIWIAFVNDPDNLFRYLRMMSTGLDEEIEAPNLGPLSYLANIGYVVLFFVFAYMKNKKLKTLFFILNFFFALVSMSKTSFLALFLPLLYILFRKGVVRYKHLFISVAAFFAFSFSLQVIRAGSNASADSSEVEGSSFLSLYMLSSMVAFDNYAAPASSEHWGERVFRIYYAISHSLGGDIPPKQNILDFVGVPELTNTYTVMYPFYIDFGLWGVAFFAMLYGLLYGYLYKKNLGNISFYTIIYAIFLNFIVMSFIGEFIVTNASQNLQYIFFALIPYLIPPKRSEVCTQ